MTMIQTMQKNNYDEEERWKTIMMGECREKDNNDKRE